MIDWTATPWRACALGVAAGGGLIAAGLAIADLSAEEAIRLALKWLHVLAGAVWVGLIWFVNFVQLPALASAQGESAKTILHQIAPKTAWWFRHMATVTVVSGALLALAEGLLIGALSLGLAGDGASASMIVLGIGIWLALLMWLFVWVVIWPSLSGLLGGTLTGETAARARSRIRTFARANLALSVIVVLTMVQSRVA